MPASYPSSAKSFTTKNTGNTVQADHVNDLQAEVTAVETDLIAGLPVARGGTGNTSITANRIPYGNGTSALQSSANLTFDGSTFTTAAIVATTVTPSGLIDASGAAAGQIKFPASQNASTNANTLDDYEEGTWTPVIGGSGGTSGQAYSSQVGTYLKVGKTITAWFDVTLSTKGTITTAVQIQGLPVAASSMRAAGCISFFANLGANWIWLGVVSDASAATATVTGSQAAAAASITLTTTDITDTTRFIGCLTYQAAA